MTRLLIVSLAVLTASAAFAQDKRMTAAAAGSDTGQQQQMTAPQPSKELENWMKPLEGSWKCDTKMMPGAMGPGSPETTSRSTVKISKDRDTNGVWYRGEYSMPKTKSSPGMTGIFMLGATEQAPTQILSTGYDSMGGAALGVGTLSGDTISYTSEGYMMGQKMKMRETMTKTGEKSVTHKYEADTGRGFQPMGEDVCKK
jgi:hypothetical protein